jgi:hypothetical protein
MAIESSIMSSLDELRAIHTQRIADERASFAAERRAVIEARQRTEDAQRALAEAKIRDAREAQLRLEQARVAAEREARMKLEAEDAAVRTRFAAELLAERQQQELELRRAEVAKQRPKWMVAVTTLAVAAGLGLGYFGYQRSIEADASAKQRAIAEQQKQEAKRQAAAATVELAAIETKLDTIHGRLDEAVKELALDDKEADRERARKAIAAAQRAEAEERQNILDLKRKKEHDDRIHGLHQENCVGTSLGCMPAK